MLKFDISTGSSAMLEHIDTHFNHVGDTQQKIISLSRLMTNL